MRAIWVSQVRGEVRKGGNIHLDKDMEFELAYGFQLLDEMFLQVDAAEGC